MYTSELEQLILRHGLHIRQYADDSHVYICVSVSEVRVPVHSFTVCIHDVNEWMRVDERMRLIQTKTQVMWFGSGQQLKYVDINNIPLLPTIIQFAERARDLGVILYYCKKVNSLKHLARTTVTESQN